MFSKRQLNNRKQIAHIPLCLVSEFIQDYLIKRSIPVVQAAKATLPIVWFGDSRAYFASDRKIVTIGINPSWQEFSENRFIAIGDWNKPETRDRVAETLDCYFETNPYWTWFRHFETVLNLLGSSYKTGCFQNRALHVDIQSSLATKPTWGDPTFGETNRMKIKRPDLFKKLLAVLDPDIIVFSVNENERKTFFGDFVETDSRSCCKNGIPVRGVFIRLYRKGNVHLLTGRNLQGTPFGGMSDEWIRNTVPNLKWETTI